MNPYQHRVEQFHRATGGTVGQGIAIRDAELRAKLILEEAVETCAAMGIDTHVIAWAPDSPAPIFESLEEDNDQDLVAAIDGLCDLLYVTFGTAVAMGIDLDRYFDEVHRSNMEKTTGPKRADGKQLKPEGWMPPRLATLLAQEPAA